MFAKVPEAAAVDFIASGAGGNVVYRFTPETGTLHDLKVIVNGSFVFYPSNGGGISQFELAGETLWSWEKSHTSRLINETNEDGTYKARFRWTYKGESFDFVVTMKLDGMTLRIRTQVDASVWNVVVFSLDRSENTPDPKIFVLPYGHPVLWTNKTFISAVIDGALSNASIINTQKERYSATSAFFGSAAVYQEMTNGKRNSLDETVLLTVSKLVEDTFGSLENPVSPYRDVLAGMIVLDLWKDSFQETREDLKTLAALGLKDLLVIIHNWQKFGYDNALPTAYPAGSLYGGDGPLREIGRMCGNSGYLLSLHTNYVDFYPNSSDWDTSGLAINGDRHWIKAWYNPLVKVQSYLMKPAKALGFAGIYEPSIHSAYSTKAGYLDVHTAVLPSFKVDFDASVAGAGRQKTTLNSYRNLIGFVRNTHKGPVVGEGFGYSASTWAGLIDGIEADPRSLDDLSLNKGGTDVPTIVDYKLKVLNPHFIPHGAGYLPRFYRGKWSGFTRLEMERYRATELAYGNAGFMTNPFENNAEMIDILRDYCFMKAIQPYYLRAVPVEVSYYHEGYAPGASFTLSTALHAILSQISHNSVDTAILEAFSQMKIRYNNGFVLYVNRDVSRPWDVSVNGLSATLPPGGFLAVKGDFLAYTALVNGMKTYYISSGENPCLGHLDSYIYPPIGISIERVTNRSLLMREMINIVRWNANSRNAGISKYRIYLGEGNQRTLLGETDAGALEYRHRQISPDVDYKYAIVAVNGEGREGEAVYYPDAGPTRSSQGPVAPSTVGPRDWTIKELKEPRRD